MSIKIAHLVTSNKKSGGNVYESYMNTLDDTFDVTRIVLTQNRKKNKVFKLIEYFWNLYKFSKNEYLKNDICIRNVQGCFFMDKDKTNIVIFHHYDPHPNHFMIGLYQKFLHRNLLRNLDKIDTMVVVSRYWQEYFHTLGFARTKIIYNPFEIDRYNLRNATEIEAFKDRYHLNEKPIVYIGNAQAIKGTDKVYEQLKSLDVHLVTSGISQIELPAVNLQLSFEEYITLLQASSVVVLMSQIKEGWNRVAHEAILCRTPVIGSGSGGMKELLEGSEQQICQDWTAMTSMVTRLLKNPVVCESGYEYAVQFHVEKFKSSWMALIKERIS